MRKLLPALFVMVVVFGLFNPARAETRNTSKYYDNPLAYVPFQFDGTENSVGITVNDDMRWSVAGHYQFEKTVCTGGGYGDPSQCTTSYPGSGYFCRYTNVAVPDGTTSLTVSVVVSGLNKLYCGTPLGATKGRVDLEIDYTPDPGGGGGCSMAPAYMKQSPEVDTRHLN